MAAPALVSPTPGAERVQAAEDLAEAVNWARGRSCRWCRGPALVVDRDRVVVRHTALCRRPWTGPARRRGRGCDVAGGAGGAQARADTSPPPGPVRSTSKYTLLLDARLATTLDELALRLRRRTGRRVEKSALLRALIMLAADDPTLLDEGFLERIGGRAAGCPDTVAR